jgi:phosphoribosylcarboxyaminoimidazole (NCAIR) mutase
MTEATPTDAAPAKAAARSPLVGIVGGSRSDFPTLEAAVAILDELGVPSELKVVSAHRTPDHLFRYAEEAAGRGIRVIVAGAGGAAHLPEILALGDAALSARLVEWRASQTDAVLADPSNAD